MFFFEKFFSLGAFAIGWGIIVTLDLILRFCGLAGTYGIDFGLIFPYASPIMSAIVIFAFVYFLVSPNQALSKQFYSSCSYLMLIVLTGSLLIDFVLRFTAFNFAYCRGEPDMAACKEAYSSSLWLDLCKIAAAIRVMFYATEVLETYRDTVEKQEPIDN